ncbi:diphthine--ammonia ligase [Clostridium taeniosporum]|uniref:ATP-binding protein n=1 Tax=Clostridium taeniosporum TaxID=394958 RepID=A0A1D7XMC0_9CLOT|nr:diphthine--ammonia ligase [Clostridium taeniosporum]AOR24259.1 ATP-binding protein [Clostridium taeniosporum]
MENFKFVTSYSGGKDSVLSLYRMINKGYKPAGILVTFDKDNTSWFHKVPKELFIKTSKELNIPLIEVECFDGNNYSKKFSEELKKLKEKEDINLCVFGDIDIENHRKWCLDVCREAGMKAEFPLWNENREKLTKEFLEAGFSTVIKKVNLDLLNQSFLGLKLDFDVIKELKKTGCDVSGENGEYHTFVYDGPIFNNKIEFNIINKQIYDNYGYLIIK